MIEETGDEESSDLESEPESSNTSLLSATTSSSKKHTGICARGVTVSDFFGNTVASATVNCSFYYNGSKAWYRSDFSAHYTVSGLNSMTQWSKTRERSGTSYVASCSGVAQGSVAIFGNTIVFSNIPIAAKMKLTKDGSLIFTHTP